jgi:hypothetical protein
MLDEGKTPLKVVHTKPAVCLLAAKMAALRIIALRGVRTSSHNWLLFLGVRLCLNIFLVSETKYTNIVSKVA